jgi:endogenous inhibitor of DNA gyrase (YacG/DUF329 family)
MTSKCPGQDSRNIKAEIVKCPRCGYDVEIFSDEIRVKCPNCKKSVYRERIPSCVDWCPSAKECVGEKKWKEIKASK